MVIPLISELLPGSSDVYRTYENRHRAIVAVQQVDVRFAFADELTVSANILAFPRIIFCQRRTHPPSHLTYRGAKTILTGKI